MDNKVLSDRALNITASVTLAITNKAREMKKAGAEVVSFGAGEPDFDTPNYIKAGAKRALDEGFTKYTANSGFLELRSVICDKLLKENGLSYKPNQIIVSNGAKQALFNALFALCNYGDEVIVFSPYWVTYIDQIKMSGGVPVVVETKKHDGFRIDFKAFEEKITSKTKVVIINTPNNPTGVVYTMDEIKEISRIVKKYNLYVISDEIYEKIIYFKKHISIASLDDEIKKRTIVINGFSKSFSMTGWRVGYLATSNDDIADAVNKLQSHITSNANSIAQKAAYTALSHDSDFDFSSVISKFLSKRNYLVKELNSIPFIDCFEPDGAFYVFPDISKCFGKKYEGKIIENDLDFCEILLNEKKVAVVPGSAFGNGSFIRLSYALSFEDMLNGMSRIEDFCNKLE